MLPYISDICLFCLKSKSPQCLSRQRYFCFLVLSDQQREHSYLFLWHHLHNGCWHGCFWTWVIETCKTNVFLKRVNYNYFGLFFKWNTMWCETRRIRLGLVVSHSNASWAMFSRQQPLQASAVSPPRATMCLCHPTMIGQRPLLWDALHWFKQAKAHRRDRSIHFKWWLCQETLCKPRTT